tara:strand:+ start:368 stop:580 length:213 start_codon:yes stop_codon:yes gene_type:complete
MYKIDNYTILPDSDFGWTVKLKDHRGSIQWQVDLQDKKIIDVWEDERCGITRKLPRSIRAFIERKLEGDC